MPPVYRGASEEQFQEWEKLIDQGVPRFEASRLAGTTLRRLRNGDEVRFEKGVELSQERQAAMVEKLIVDQTDRPEPSPQLLALRAKATHPDYADKRQVEVTGADGGPIEVEKREVSLVAVLGVLAQIGALDQLGAADAGPLRALAGAQEVLPPPADA